MAIKKFILLLTCCCFIGGINAETYYISPDGNDGNDGRSPGNAWDLEYAVSQNSPLGPGDSLIAVEGLYSDINKVEFEKSGEMGNPIVFKGNPRAVFDGGGNFKKYFGVAMFDFKQQSHWILDGLVLQNAQFWGIALKSCHYITVQNCKTFYTCAGGIVAYPESNSKGGEAAITSSNIKFIGNRVERACAFQEKINADGGGGTLNEAMDIWGVDTFEVAYNVVCYSHKEGIDVKTGARNGSVHHNHCHHMNPNGTYTYGGNGIYNDGGWAASYNIDIYRNFINHVENGTGIAISDEQVDSGSHHDIRVYNNVVYSCREGFGGGNGVNNLTIINNTAIDNTFLGLSISGKDTKPSQNMIVRNNLVASRSDMYHFPIRWDDHIYGEIDNNIFIDAKGEEAKGSATNMTHSSNQFILQWEDIFAADEDFDWSPKDNSSIQVNAGNSSEAPDIDFWGQPRSGNPDIGAIESGYNLSGAPAAPTNLVAQATGPNSVKLTWTDNSDNEMDFWIERKYLDDRWVMVNTAMPNETEYNDSLVASATTYKYRVRAFNFEGYSFSNETSIITFTGGNLAVNKHVASVGAPGYPSKPNYLAVDGRRWGGFGTNYKPFWFIVDLGEVFDIKQVNTVMNGNTDYRFPAYKIEVAIDSSNWEVIVDENDTIPRYVAEFPVNRNARYVRLSAPDGNYKYTTLNELEVIHNADVTPVNSDLFKNNLSEKIDLLSVGSKPVVDIALKNTASISVTMYRLDGKVVAHIPLRQLSAGNHALALNTDSQLKMGEGFYICEVSVKNRAGIVHTQRQKFVFGNLIQK